MDLKELKKQAADIYKTSMEFQRGTPRTRYRELKIEEAPIEHRYYLRTYMQQMSKNPDVNQMWNRYD